MALCLVFLLAQFMPVISVYAAQIPEDDKKAIDLDSVHHKIGVDERNCGGASPAGGSGGVASGQSVYILGDSITVRSETVYRTKFAEKNITPIINAAESRSWNGAGSSRASTEGTLRSGKDAVQDDSAKIGAAGGIVIALGTNGGYGGNPIESAIDAVRQINSTAPIWWVNTAGTSAWPRDLGYLGDFNNRLIGAAGSKNYKIVDWFSAVTPGGDPKVSPTNDPGGLLADGIHPSANGQIKLSEIVSAAVAGNTDSGTSAVVSGSTCCASSGSTVTGDGNEEKVWNYLVGTMGFSAVQAAGIMGNIEEESGFSPTALNRDSGAYGLIQWFAGRKTGLENYAREKGKDIGDLAMQLDYMKQELESSYKAKVLDPIKASSTLEEATAIWLVSYEVPCFPLSSAGCVKQMGIRVPQAQNWLTLFGNNTGSATANSSGSICGAGGVGVSASGFVFPLKTDKNTIKTVPGGAWCSTSQVNCHHDYNAADIFAPTGTEVIAAKGGTVIMSKSGPGRVVIKADDGNIYYYTHMGEGTVVVAAGQAIAAGATIGRVGTRADAAGTLQHLHIDALPGDQFGNRPACAGASCSNLPFLELQPALVESFNALP